MYRRKSLVIAIFSQKLSIFREEEVLNLSAGKG